MPHTSIPRPEPPPEVGEIAIYRNGKTPHPEESTNELNPLDTSKGERLRLGWIDDYTDLISTLTGSPKEFNRLAALIMLTSLSAATPTDAPPGTQASCPCQPG